jgi:alpha-D-xyloside xylohydrolase
MFGPDLFIAPVLQPGGRVRYYLPRGNWSDFWSRQPRPGGGVLEEQVALDRIPLDVRTGATLELGPPVQSTGALAGESEISETLTF